MAKLPKYTLSFNDRKEKWDLHKDKTNSLIKSFETKDNATKGGVLKKTIGKEGGSVKIQKENGRFQEERTYPKSKDPKKSKG
jgi:glutathionylspermidine synthase